MSEWVVTVKDGEVVFQPKGTKLDFMVLTLTPEAAFQLGDAFLAASKYVVKSNNSLSSK